MLNLRFHARAGRPSFAAWARWPRDTRDTLFVLAVIATVVLPLAPSLPGWSVGLVAGVLAWRGWLALSLRPLPAKTWVLALLCLTVLGTLISHGSLLGRDAGVTLIVVLLSLKTLELRARRDIFVVFFLGFFSLLTHFFYSQSLLTAASLLVGVFGLLTAMVNAHMPVGKPPLRQAAKTAGWLTLLGAPIMLVLFMLFPRMAPLWGLPGEPMAGRTGLSNSMEVGTVASLALDSSVVMRLKFFGPQPAQRDLYFRGPVLSTFDGRSWQALRSGFGPAYALPANLRHQSPILDYEVTLEPSQKPWLFVLEAATQPPQLARPGLSATMQADLQWLTNRPVSDLIRYRAQSATTFRHGPLTPSLGLQDHVDLPPGFNPRTLELAAQIRRDPRFAQASAAELVEMVLQRLRTGGYTYTLQPGLSGQHTADEFWFDRRAGFCEHIASAFVILMRGLDVPARVVTGYQGGERNGVDGFWVVRQSDAHAWAEVWQENIGWIRVDPTAAVAPGRTGGLDRLAAPQGAVGAVLGNFSPALLTQVRTYWSALNNLWNQNVLNYTQSRQLDLLKSLGINSPGWEDLAWLLVAAGGVGVLVAALGPALSRHRRQRDPWLRLLAKARQRATKAGLRNSDNASPRQLAERLEQQHGAAAKAAADWLMTLERVRYAPSANGVASSSTSEACRQLQRQYRRLVWPA